MKKVSEVKEVSRGRFSVVFEDGEKAVCGLNIKADFSLYEGRELNDEECSRLQSALQRTACRERAMRILSAVPLSERELYDRLVQKGESPENAADSVAYAISLHFLNDEEYAENLVRKAASKGYGKRRAADELYRHKIPKELWDEALSHFPESDDKLLSLVSSGLRGEDASDPAVIKKLSARLMRRGYGWGEIKAAIRQAAGDCDESFDDPYYNN